MTTQDPESSEAPAHRRGSPDAPGPDWLYRWRRRVAGDSRYRQLVWRSVATALGAGIVIAGIVLLPLPGPGWAIIFLGLAVLATEYAWAHRLLTATRDKATSATANAFSPENRRRTIALLVIVALVVASLVAWYVESYGWTLRGMTGWLSLR